MPPHFGLQVDALLLAWTDDSDFVFQFLRLSVLRSLARPWLFLGLICCFCLLRHARPVGVTYMQTMNGQTGPVTRRLRVVWHGMAWHGVVWCGVLAPGSTVTGQHQAHGSLSLSVPPSLYLCLCRFLFLFLSLFLFLVLTDCRVMS